MKERQFTEVGGAVNYITVAPNKIPAFKVDETIVEGEFVRSFKGVYGMQHEFMVAGQRTILNGVGSINHKMQDVEAKSYCKIIYKGKKLLTKGARAGREFHDCVLLVEPPSVSHKKSNMVMKEVAPTETLTQDDSFLA